MKVPNPPPETRDLGVKSAGHDEDESETADRRSQPAQQTQQQHARHSAVQHHQDLKQERRQGLVSGGGERNKCEDQYFRL